MVREPDALGEPRICLLGKVRVAGEGTQPLSDREAAAARRLLVLLVLEANPLELDHLRGRLFAAANKRTEEQLAKEIRRARSAVVQALGVHGELLQSRAGETALEPALVERTDLLLLYQAADVGDWESVRDLLEGAEDEPLGGVSEFPQVHDAANGGLRLRDLCSEHRTNVARIRDELESSVRPERQGDAQESLQPSTQHGRPEGPARERRARTPFRRAGWGAALLVAGSIVAGALIIRDGNDTPPTRSPGGQTSTTARATVQRAGALTAIRREITGGSARTWTDYTTAGGTSGPPLNAEQVVRITCRVKGFPVQPDNNPWWYLLAESPYDKAYFATADAFYNRPHLARGSFKHSLRVDQEIPVCP